MHIKKVDLKRMNYNNIFLSFQNIPNQYLFSAFIHI
jgi:hypothetical protein